jgi:X-Pro dipeptidyl-peptidase
MSRATFLLVALLFLSPALAGCLGGGSDAAADAGDAGVGGPASTGVNGYLRNLSEPDTSVTVVGSILEHLKIPVIDGVRLDTWIVRPETDEQVPVVIEVTPYYSGGSPINDDGTHRLGRVGNELIPRGYAYGVVSVRGTGNSEGCFTQGGPTEARDTAAVIEHLAALPWSNGNVGLIGVSYPGTTPQDVWVEAPPSLKTIVPISGISDMYKYNFVNGVPINVQGFGFNAYYWALVGAPPGGYTGTGFLDDPLAVPMGTAGEACTDQVFVQEGGASSTLDGNKDAYWMVRDFHAELLQSWDKERASVFYIHGLQDWNVKPHMMEDWLPAVQATGVPYKVWIGQWAHNWPQRDDWFNSTMIAWFDEFLKEVDTGVLDAPPVQVQDDDGVWRHETQWPPVDVDWVTLSPTRDGTLSANESATGTARYFDYWGALAPEELDQGPAEVVWMSDPVTEDMTISGLPVFEGSVTASGSRASLMLTLAEVDGQTLRPINYAALSLNHAQGLDQGDPDISGRTQQVRVQFFPQDDVVHEGNRIALIASGNLVGTGNLVDDGAPGPSLQPVSDGSTITIDLAGAKLKLPVDMSRVVEWPQPCWDEDTGEADDCYLIR